MKNKDLFEELSIRILKELYESFPVPLNLNKNLILEEVINYPDPPFKSHGGVTGSGIYVGPNLEWIFDTEKINEIWDNYDWEDCIKCTESLIQRALTDEEKEKLLHQGVRPYTEIEKCKMQKWKSKVRNYRETLETQKHKKAVFTGTLQFLVNEGYVRVIDLPAYADKKLQPSDVLIKKSVASLELCLTNKGYIHLNKKPPISKDSVYDSIKSHVANKSVDIFTQLGAGSILSAFLGS